MPDRFVTFIFSISETWDWKSVELPRWPSHVLNDAETFVDKGIRPDTEELMDSTIETQLSRSEKEINTLAYLMVNAPSCLLGSHSFSSEGRKGLLVNVTMERFVSSFKTTLLVALYPRSWVRELNMVAEYCNTRCLEHCPFLGPALYPLAVHYCLRVGNHLYSHLSIISSVKKDDSEGALHFYLSREDGCERAQV